MESGSRRGVERDPLRRNRNRNNNGGWRDFFREILGMDRPRIYQLIVAASFVCFAAVQKAESSPFKDRCLDDSQCAPTECCAIGFYLFRCERRGLREGDRCGLCGCVNNMFCVAEGLNPTKVLSGLGTCRRSNYTKPSKPDCDSNEVDRGQPLRQHGEKPNPPEDQPPLPARVKSESVAPSGSRHPDLTDEWYDQVYLNKRPKTSQRTEPEYDVMSGNQNRLSELRARPKYHVPSVTWFSRVLDWRVG